MREDQSEELEKQKLDFSAGLIPTVVLDFATGEVLMLAFSSPESLKMTLETGLAHFFSRKRQKIWKKGEESGNVIRVHKVFSDCDNDSIAFIGEPSGPVCHTGESSCFFRRVIDLDEEKTELKIEKPRSNILLELQDILRDRKLNPKPDSYTTTLFSSGLNKIVEKILEETNELCKSALENFRGNIGEKNSVVWEAADVIYHILALLSFLDIPLEDVLRELVRRRKK